jgi:DNA-binding response OmpR family regulator
MSLSTAGTGTEGGGEAASRARWDALVVEDDDVLREQLAEALREEGYAVATAAHGGAALALLEAAPVGVVLLDLMLPVKSGWQVLQALRESPTLCRTPILVITALTHAFHTEARRGPVFLKPLNLASLLRAVRAYLGGHPPPARPEALSSGPGAG